MTDLLIKPTFKSVVPISRIPAATICNCFNQHDIDKLLYALTGKAPVGKRLTQAIRCTQSKAVVQLTIEVIENDKD